MSSFLAIVVQQSSFWLFLHEVKKLTYLVMFEPDTLKHKYFIAESDKWSLIKRHKTSLSLEIFSAY